MLKRKFKKSFEENRDQIIVAGVFITLMGTGYVLGRKHQKALNVKNIKNVVTLKKVAEPMFPTNMPISEIKDILSKVEGAKFFDALVTNIDGVQRLIVR